MDRGCLATQPVMVSLLLSATPSRNLERSEGAAKSLMALRTGSAKQSHYCFQRLPLPRFIGGWQWQLNTLMDLRVFNFGGETSQMPKIEAKIKISQRLAE